MWNRWSLFSAWRRGERRPRPPYRLQHRRRGDPATDGSLKDTCSYPGDGASNCKALNADYPHGVGRPGARDKTRNRSEPVTTFKISKPLYEANRESDRDDDGIACERP
jgi:Excalibur calcium-binding domain